MSENNFILTFDGQFGQVQGSEIIFPLNLVGIFPFLLVSSVAIEKSDAIWTQFVCELFLKKFSLETFRIFFFAAFWNFTVVCLGVGVYVHFVGTCGLYQSETNTFSVLENFLTYFLNFPHFFFSHSGHLIILCLFLGGFIHISSGSSFEILITAIIFLFPRACP